MNPPDIHAGYWAMPSNISSNSFHRFADRNSPSLCGRWPAGSHTTQSPDSRLNIIAHMDCRKCQKLFKEQLAAIPDRWVCTHNAHRAWCQQLRPIHCSRSTFQRHAIKAGIRYWTGTLLWDGYWWHAGDLARRLDIDVPHSQSDSIGDPPKPVCLP